MRNKDKHRFLDSERVSQSNFRKTWDQEQCIYGSTFFFSCLYSLAVWMAERRQKTSGIFYQTLGHIRSITGCPLLIHALNLLFSKKILTLPHRVAIQECLVLLFKMIKPKTPLYLKMQKSDGILGLFLGLFDWQFKTWTYAIGTILHIQTHLQ